MKVGNKLDVTQTYIFGFEIEQFEDWFWTNSHREGEGV